VDTLCLYFSGRAHAGENLKALLDKRAAERDPPLVMSDALAHNEAEGIDLIRCHCMAHGRRKFTEIESAFPEACEEVVFALKQVFDHEEKTKQERRSAEARLAYHQAYSGPIMAGLKTSMEGQVARREVEPNSSLGKALAYWLDHWQTLTQFLRVPGAPLENNTAERALKLIIRQRKNSLFYKNDPSAYVASLLTSLIATCVQAGVNAMEYLVALQENRSAVFAHPARWLPWTYQSELACP
jgi:transposase